VTPVNCVCGAGAYAQINHNGHWVECDECEWTGPIRETEVEAVEAWNRVMRPRPVVTENHHPDNESQYSEFALGALTVSDVYHRTGQEFSTTCPITNEEHRGTFADCRAWLVAKLEAAGFDVKEANDAND
jgi:hypothetical protein